MKFTNKQKPKSSTAYGPWPSPYGLRSTASHGFTLVEMIVSLAVFALVMMIAVGALLSIVNANRKAQAQQIALNNLNFAVENMTRSIRTGTYYHCGSSGSLSSPQDCASGSDFFAFEAYGGDTSNSGDQVVYRLNSGQLQLSTDGGTTFAGVTAPEITINNLTFYTIGSTIGDGNQPEVLITINGFAEISVQASVNFNLQTTVSQRLFDI